jgi:hypothetical protein
MLNVTAHCHLGSPLPVLEHWTFADCGSRTPRHGEHPRASTPCQQGISAPTLRHPALRHPSPTTPSVTRSTSEQYSSGQERLQQLNGAPGGAVVSLTAPVGLAVRLRASFDFLQVQEL